MPLLHTKSAATFLKRHAVPRTWMSRDSLSRACSRRTFDIVLVDVIHFEFALSLFLNDLECSLSNICYIAKNNINKNEKKFEMNKEVGMLLPPKRANTSGLWKVIINMRISVYAPPYSNTH